jgi:hypothetical protein
MLERQHAVIELESIIDRLKDKDRSTRQALAQGCNLDATSCLKGFAALRTTCNKC